MQFPILALEEQLRERNEDQTPDCAPYDQKSD